MQYLLLILVIIFLPLQNICQKQYNIKESNPNVFLFMSLASLSALVFFLASSGLKLNFTFGILFYSAAFAASYAAACIGLILAIRFGSLAITGLINSYSLIIPALYGIIFLKEPVGVRVYVGIVLLLISLFLHNIKAERVKASVKWFIFLAMAFIGNGMCSTVQKMQQIRYGGEYKSEFMIIALAIAFVIFSVCAVYRGVKKNKIISCVKFALPNGIFNGAVNMLVMILTGLIPNAVLFPSISAGGIVLNCLAAVFIYKEKLTSIQIVGYIMGTSAVVLLNL